MTVVALAGTGAVARRAARQLVESPGVTRLLVGGRHRRGLDNLVAALGPTAEAWSFRAGDPIPDNVDVVVSALPDELDAAVARAAIDVGAPMVSAADGSGAIAALRALSKTAIDAGVAIVAGCGFAPGLSEVLAAHAAALYDAVDEVRVARYGWASGACAASMRREHRDVAAVWRDGVAREVGRRVEQVWFPEPVAVRDCVTVRGASELALDAVPGAGAVTWLLGEVDKAPARRLPLDVIGALRVEVWGRRADGARDVTVYGALDRVSIAAGAVLALGALAAVRPGTPAGVHSLGRVVEPVPFLSALAARGVHPAVFEGAPVS